MLLANILNPKVVYHKSQRHGARLVTPYDCSVSGWAVSIGVEMFGDMVVG